MEERTDGNEQKPTARWQLRPNNTHDRINVNSLGTPIKK